MRILKVSLVGWKKNDLGEIAACLRAGGVIAYPTDTIYGLGCLATEESAIKRIYRLKKRARLKPLLVLLSGWRRLNKYVYLRRAQLDYLRTIWPGPVTAVFESKNILPRILTVGQTALAVRWPAEKFLCALLRRLPAPLVSTSLNISGQPALGINGLEKIFKRRSLDLAVDAGPLPPRPPSRIIDVRDLRVIRLIRE